jgi:anti-sigma factor RsiW
MKCKKYEEKIILYLYGELGEKERAELENHINECPECSKDFAYTKKVFKALDKSKQEVPEANWEKCWREIDTGAHKKPSLQKSSFFFPRWAYVAAALLLVFVLGAIIGRFLFFPSPQAVDEQALSPSSIQFTLQEYFEELKPVLIEYANFTSSEKGEETILMDKEMARNLLIP